MKHGKEIAFCAIDFPPDVHLICLPEYVEQFVRVMI